MNRWRTPTQEEAGLLVAMLAFIFGGWVRLLPASISGFPINDGGLFSVMIDAVQANHWALPAYFQYNGQIIPFAYPPLVFYLGALTSTLLKVGAIDVVRWLPGIVAVGTLPAFYYLASALLDSSYKAGIATLMYAFTPRSMTWIVMGGGLTRSFGLLFLLLSLASIYRLLNKKDRNLLPACILFSTLVVLSHPEAALHTITTAILLWMFKGRSKAGIINALTVGLGTILLTSIWWLPTLLRLGAGPFLAAANTGSQSAISIFYPFLLTLTDEPLITIVAVLGLIGFATCLRSRRYILPLWYFLPFIVDPRSGATYAMLPLAMLAGIGLSEVVLPGLARYGNRVGEAVLANVFGSRAATMLLAILGVYMLGSSVFFGTELAGTTVSEANRITLNWIRDNISAGSRFLVLTGESEPFCDGLEEWFPALTDRISITTIQGDEWLPGGKFAQAVNLQNALQGCVEADSPLRCIDEKHLQFDYVYLSRQDVLKTLCRATAPVKRGDALMSELAQDGRFQTVYQSAAVAVFALQH